MSDDGPANSGDLPAGDPLLADHVPQHALGEPLPVVEPSPAMSPLPVVEPSPAMSPLPVVEPPPHRGDRTKVVVEPAENRQLRTLLGCVAAALIGVLIIGLIAGFALLDRQQQAGKERQDLANRVNAASNRAVSAQQSGDLARSALCDFYGRATAADNIKARAGDPLGALHYDTELAAARLALIRLSCPVIPVPAGVR